ncbi:MAG: hypothetical protein CVU39_22145 [Chloroflexi bacterium HGW-Chloroflexi-10]|nr:MAG: hypothetical protein CVU39_22145 [Chloroflexi bacterium HGW-Chloroflexi-10]
MFMHNSLSAHWILLFAIWFIVLEYRHKLWRGAWILLFAASLLVHPYLVAMLVPLWAISLYFQSMHEKKIWPKVVVDILAVSGVLLLVGYSIGIFSLKINHLAQSSYGFYSWNMNGFLNPLYTSAFLKEMLTGTSGQYEGYSYLGLGNLLILIAAFYLLVQKDVPRRQLSFILPFLIAASLFVLFSLTNQGLLGNRLLWDFKLPQFISDLFGMFQGSGRFIWPVFYFLVLFGLIYIIRNDRLPTLILALGLIIQLADMQPLIEIKRIEGTAEYQTPMQSEFWSQAAQSNRHLFLLPAWDDVISIYQPIALYAQQNQLTINWSFFARGDYVSIATLGRQVWQELQAGQSDPQTMYIFWHPEWVENAQENLAGNMLLCTVDGYTIALSVENPITRTNFDLNPYCTFP